MGNVVPSIRPTEFGQSVLPKQRAIPHCMNKWENLGKVFKAMASSRNTLTLDTTASLPAESSSVKTQQEMRRIDTGGNEIARSEGLPPIYTFADLETVQSLPYQRGFPEEGEVPIVDWEYMTSVPEYSPEDIAEKRLWDEYTRLHSPPAGTIPWDELFEQERFCSDDAINTESDVVQLDGSDEKDGGVHCGKEVGDVTEDIKICGNNGMRGMEEDAMSKEDEAEIIDWDEMFEKDEEENKGTKNVTDADVVLYEGDRWSRGLNEARKYISEKIVGAYDSKEIKGMNEEPKLGKEVSKGLSELIELDAMERGEGEILTTEDVTDVDIETVVLDECEKAEVAKNEGVSGKTGRRAGRSKWSFVVRFLKKIGSLIKHEV